MSTTRYIVDNASGQTINGESILPKYKVYTALLSQFGTDAPVATVLENTIGNIVWTRGNIGTYFATLPGAFTINKTAVILGPINIFNTNISFMQYESNNSSSNNTADFLIFSARAWDGVQFTSADDFGTDLLVEIRVYN